ncbi:probable G-protein coupled receptor 150 [Pogoniulus pusillus]|uniref:probable G-protein coupled receptor 150 n=1 Tax=Pogoniulus pusillus TaxID=488313 RepID=UPI0030B992A1
MPDIAGGGGRAMRCARSLLPRCRTSTYICLRGPPGAAEFRCPGMEQDSFSSDLNLSAPGSPPSFPGPRAAWAGSVLLLAVLGNGLVLRGLCGVRPSRRRDLLLGHLALADLAGCGLALLPRLAAEGLLAGAAAASPPNPGVCRLLPVLQRCGPLASAHGLVLLALERHRPRLPARGLAALGWLLAPLLALPQAFAFRLASRQGGTRCRSVFEELPRWHGVAFAVYGAATAFLAPAGLLGWTCARSLTALGAARRRRRRQGGRRRPAARSGGGVLSRGRAVRLPLVLTALFALCRLPHCAAELGLTLLPGSVRQEALLATGIVEVANSALNPFACLLLHSRLRRGLCGTGTSKVAAAGVCCPGSGGQGRRWATLRRPLRLRAGTSTTGTRSYPGTSGVPGTPGSRGISGIPGSSCSPSTPATPGTRSTPGIRDTSGNLGTSCIPDTPGCARMPGTRSIPSTPSSADTSGSPVPRGSPPGTGLGSV